MANPNIANLTNLIGNNSLTSLTTTNATEIISNAASSGKVYKVNTIWVSNVDGASPFDITLSVYDQDNIGGTAFQIASTVSVPADSTIIVVDKNSSLYLKEDQSIGATASSASKLKVVASWEEIN